LTPDLAEVAATLASTLGVNATAERLGVAPSTLFGAWQRYQTPRPAQRLGPEHRPSRQRKLDRAKVTEAAALAREVGITEAARRYGVSDVGLRKAARRFGVPLRGRWTNRAA
jgi:transposase-like protein